MTLVTNLICNVRRPHTSEGGEFINGGRAIGTGGGGPFVGTVGGGPWVAVKTGGIIDWWITDRPPGITVML